MKTQTSLPTLALIAAVANNDIIGGNNRLLWRLSADLARFKALTSGHCIVMGQKTFASLGRLLPNRHHLVLTRHPEKFSLDQFGFDARSDAPCHAFGTLTEAMDYAAKQTPNQTLWVIGGGEIYQLAMPVAQHLYITEVFLTPQGDTTFPSIDLTQWEQSDAGEWLEEEGLKYRFMKWSRIM